MSDEDDYEFFKLRKEAKTYISKLFHWNRTDDVGKRSVKMIMDGCDEIKVGEIQGAMCLRQSGSVRKTQVAVIVSQDHKRISRVTLQTFKTRAGEWTESVEKEEFTFRFGEFQRLLNFLRQIEFIDFSDTENFHIEDISTQTGPKVIVDAPDGALLSRIKDMPADARKGLFASLKSNLSAEEINILLGRKDALAEFSSHLEENDWSEADWQNFFEREQWVFGYGLDYRILRHFDREMTVGGGGSDNKDKPIIDFLETFKDYTVLVEIKKPNTPIFKSSRGGRSGTWEFSSDFIGAVSQIVEQKAEWLAYAQNGDHYNHAGTEKLRARTRNAKALLVIGSQKEFETTSKAKEAEIKRDTFELFRQETRSIDIVTYDELYERAKFITRNK